MEGSWQWQSRAKRCCTSRGSRGSSSSEDEVVRFQEQLSAILEAVSKVSELDLSDVPPTSHPLAIANAWAEDEPRPSLDARRGVRERARPRRRLFPHPAGGHGAPAGRRAEVARAAHCR